MIAVLSATEHDFYAMPLPLAVYSWRKLGVNCIVFVPSGDNPKIELAKKYCPTASFFDFKCEEKRIPTYSQVSRLFAAAIPILHYDETLITADSDICVFDGLMHLINQMEPVEIIGADLTPNDQYPMCFVKMSVHLWKYVLGIDKTYQEHLAELIDPIQGLNIRGEQWCFDQWYIKKRISESGIEPNLVNRSNGQNQFATRRADRDGWHFNHDGLVDAHLPRPLTDEDNMNKVIELFKVKYPTDDLNWIREYAAEYRKLL
jgi:hypothetical protein